MFRIKGRRRVRMTPEEHLANALARIFRAHEETARLQDQPHERWLRDVVLLSQEDTEWLSHPFGPILSPSNGEYTTIQDHAERLLASEPFVEFARELTYLKYDLRPRYDTNIRCIVLVRRTA